MDRAGTGSHQLLQHARAALEAVPSERYHKAVQAGWQRLDADEHALFMAFSIEEPRKVAGGKIRVDGDLWYHADLFLHEGETVTVRRPKYTDWSALPVSTKRGGLLCLVARDEPVSHTSKDGALEASRRRKGAIGTIRELARDVSPLDIPALMRRSAEAASPWTPIPPSAGTIGLSEQMSEIGRAVLEAPAARRARETREKERHIAERLAIHARFRAVGKAG